MGTPKTGAFGVSGYLAWHMNELFLVIFRRASCTKELNLRRQEGTQKALHGVDSWRKHFTSIWTGLVLDGPAGREDVETLVEDRSYPSAVDR